MRLIDVLLEIRKDDSKYAINNHGYGIRYKKDKDIMVYCDRETGEYSNNIIVISSWSYDNLFADGCAICGGQRPLMRISAAARRSLTATLVRFR